MTHPYPHFLIVGFMKAATTSVFDHLLEHPGVQPPLQKELHYFTRELDPYYPLPFYGLEYREQLQYDPTSTRLCGEASPSYIIAADRIAAFNANAKIIIMLRDPVDRALSQCKQYLKYRIISSDDSFLELPMETLNFVQDSNYETYLQSFFEHFPASNIMLVSFEEFCKSENEAMRAIFRFLGLVPLAVAASKHLSASPDVRLPDGLRGRLEDYFAARRGRVADLVLEHKPVIYPNNVDAFAGY